MSSLVNFNLLKLLPANDEVLRRQGIPDPSAVSREMQEMPEYAIRELKEICHPAGVISELTVDEFGLIFDGEGSNAGDALLKDIYPSGRHLALFALTMGDEVSNHINTLFGENELVTASMLDTAASLAAETAVEILEGDFFEKKSNGESSGTEYCVLSYSPGYCGWDITSQKKIFEYLNPGQIGISLNESCLMTPLKSVTGVLIYARRSVHLFDPVFSYCSMCRHHSCTNRLEELKSSNPNSFERRN